jgi:hypothetical protein
MFGNFQPSESPEALNHASTIPALAHCSKSNWLDETQNPPSISGSAGLMFWFRD